MVVHAYNTRLLRRPRHADHKYEATPGKVDETLSQKQNKKQKG
jgi:hypothetical protein